MLAINFVADAGKQMLESSTSVSEVIERLRQFLPVVGLAGCSLDATMSSLILSYSRPGQVLPITTMREVNVASPRLEILSGTDALLDRIERGEIKLEQATKELQELLHAPEQSLRVTRVALLVSVIGWVIFLDGFDAVTMIVALGATILTFPIDSLVRRVRLPSLLAISLTAVIVAAIPNLLAAAGLTLLVGPAVVGALYLYLPGRAFVSSVIDGLANAPLSSVARGIQALMTAGFLALGMLVGTSIGAGLGLAYDPDVTATPVTLSVIGAAVGALGIAAAWAMPRRQLLPTLAISAGGWFVVVLGTQWLSGPDWLAYAIAAGVVGIAGSATAAAQGSSTSGYIGVAILPLVPGFTLYAGMLAVAERNTSDAVTALSDAGIVSLAMAIGITIGLSLSRDALVFVRRLSWASRKPNVAQQSLPDEEGDSTSRGN